MRRLKRGRIAILSPVFLCGFVLFAASILLRGGKVEYLQQYASTRKQQQQERLRSSASNLSNADGVLSTSYRPFIAWEDVPWPTRVGVNGTSTSSCSSGRRRASLPLVSGDGFRCLADAIMDETNGYKFASSDEERRFNSIYEREGRVPVLFVKTDVIYHGRFFETHNSALRTPYLLVTHNSDYGVPRPQDLDRYGLNANLSDDNDGENRTAEVVHWFAQNAPLEKRHDRVTTIPIGFENAYWGRALPRKYFDVRRGVLETERDKLLLVNFSPGTHPSRSAALQWAKDNKPWADVVEGKSNHSQWFRDLGRYKFALSPRGNGLDCHRTWELILAGVVPVVLETPIDLLYNDNDDDEGGGGGDKLGPGNMGLVESGVILRVGRWEDVTKERLEEHWDRYGEKLLWSARQESSSLLPALLMRYWMDRIWRVGEAYVSKHGAGK